MLSMERIKKWGVDVGNNIIKQKKTDPKSAEADKVETDEYQTYREVFESHPTFAGTSIATQLTVRYARSTNQHPSQTTRESST